MSVNLLHGDCRQVLRTLPDASVHCCVTSPPYFGLRDYGVEGQIGLEETPDAWPLAWNNSLFRNEGAGLSSELIREAIAATLAMWPCPSPQGIVTFVDPSRVRRKRDPGRCYLRSGFRRVGVTKGGLITLQLLPYEFPAPQAAISAQAEIEMAA